MKASVATADPAKRHIRQRMRQSRYIAAKSDLLRLLPMSVVFGVSAVAALWGLGGITTAVRWLVVYLVLCSLAIGITWLGAWNEGAVPPRAVRWTACAGEYLLAATPALLCMIAIEAADARMQIQGWWLIAAVGGLLWALLGATSALSTLAFGVGTLAFAGLMLWQTWRHDFVTWPTATALLLMAASLVVWQTGPDLRARRAALVVMRNRQLIRQNDGQAKVIEQINVNKTETIAAASHDLRQPVHALNLLVQRLRPHLSDEMRAELYPAIRGRAAAISEMLGGLLDLTKFDSGAVRVTLESCRIGDVVRDALQACAALADAKNLQLTMEGDEDIELETDIVLFKQIVHNLVINAVKYTFKGSVVVTWTLSRSDLVLEVRDTGVGIPSSRFEDVFREYHRLPASRDIVEGLGIGLSIVQRAADLLKYRIRVSSVVGHGSVFSVVVPSLHAARKPSSPRVVIDTQPGELEGSGAFLIATLENDEVSRSAMTQMIDDWGYRTLSAANSDAFLQCMGEAINAGDIPHLIVSDFRLGESRDGLAVIEAIRHLSGRDDLPALLVTGDLSRGIQSRAAAMGGVQIIYKPARPHVLRHAITQALNR